MFLWSYVHYKGYLFAVKCSLYSKNDKLSSILLCVRRNLKIATFVFTAPIFAFLRPLFYGITQTALVALVQFPVFLLDNFHHLLVFSFIKKLTGCQKNHTDKNITVKLIAETKHHVQNAFNMNPCVYVKYIENRKPISMSV